METSTQTSDLCRGIGLFSKISQYSLLSVQNVCISIVFSFSWGDCKSQEKLKTMLMQTFWTDSKEYYAIFENGLCDQPVGPDLV